MNPMLMTDPVAPTIDATLGSVQTVVQYVMDTMAGLVNTIAGAPLLLIPTGFFIAGGCIGLAKRLMH